MEGSTGQLGERHKLRWTDAALALTGSLPRARGGGASAVYHIDHQHFVYLFGGMGDVESYDDLMRFDQHTRVWGTQQVTGKPPSNRQGHTLNLLGGAGYRLYVWGGWRGDGPVVPALKCFDIDTHRWEVRSLAQHICAGRFPLCCVRL